MMPSSSIQAPQIQETFQGRVNDPALGHAVYRYPKNRFSDPKSWDREAGNMWHFFIDIWHAFLFYEHKSSWWIQITFQSKSATSDFVAENGQLLICEHKFLFYDPGTIFDIAGGGEAKIHVVSPRMFRALDNNEHSFLQEWLDSSLRFIQSQLPDELSINRVFTRLIGKRHAGLYHVITNDPPAIHLLRRVGFGIDVTEVFFLPMGIPAPLSDLRCQLHLGFSGLAPSLNCFHKKYHKLIVPTPFCVKLGPRTSRGVYTWLVLIFAERASQPSELQLPNGIRDWSVAHPNNIFSNCGLLAPQDTTHRWPNEFNNNNQRFNESQQASTIDHCYDRCRNQVTCFSTRQETVINHGAGNNHHGQHNRNNLYKSCNDGYIEAVQMRSANGVTEMQSYQRQGHRNSMSNASAHAQASELELAGVEDAEINTMQTAPTDTQNRCDDSSQ
jgi:hypothetical protein